MSKKELIKDIEHIRSMMIRSSKFMSISGISGVLMGCYALMGAGVAYYLIFGFESKSADYHNYVFNEQVLWKLILVASLVLIASISTGILMAKSKAKRVGQSIWNPTSKALLIAIGIPLITGGIICSIFIFKGLFSLVASGLLIFYGLSLTSGSVYTFKEVRVLGFLEIILGLFALVIPGYGIWFWAIGFGVLHIVYGIIVHNKYEK